MERPLSYYSRTVGVKGDLIRRIRRIRPIPRIRFSEFRLACGRPSRYFGRHYGMSSSRRSRARRIRRLAANVFVVFLAIITVLLLVGLFLPRRYHIARSVVIRAQPERIYTDL